MRVIWIVLGSAVVVGLLVILSGCPDPVSGDTDPAGGPGSVSGVVSTAGFGVEGVRVTAGSVSATTDADGAYTLSGLTSGTTYTVTPNKTGYSFSPTSASVSAGGAGVTDIDFDAGPELPVPASYTQNIAGTSAKILIAARPWNLSFSPTVVGANLTNDGSTAWVAFDGACAEDPFISITNLAFSSQRVSLMDAGGSIVESPSASALFTASVSSDCNGGPISFSTEPITAKPILELTAFWRLLSVNRFPAGTDTTVSQSITYGVSTSQTQSFTNTFNSTAGISAGGFSASVSYTYSTTTSHSMTISDETTTSQSYAVHLPGNKEAVLAIWQLVYEITPVLKADAGELSAGHDAFGNPVDEFGYVTYTDPSFADGSTNGLQSSDLSPIDIEQENDVVPMTTFFPGP